MSSVRLRSRAPWIGALAFGFFLVTAWQRGGTVPSVEQENQVVVPAAVQVVLYGGDRFLAASVESVRAAASGRELEASQGSYRLRAHRVVAQLNPCHEDNYWIGNAALSFGGAYDLGTELLLRAIRCRYWDEMPPFLYGFNQKFFKSDIEKARRAFELAADRATTNAAGFRQMAIMVSVNALNDAGAALAMLQSERDSTRDPKLRAMLDRRVERMRALLALRAARKAYEDRFGTRLEKPAQLIQAGILKELPRDPMRIGYELRDGEFHFRQLKIPGLN